MGVLCKERYIAYEEKQITSNLTNRKKICYTNVIYGQF